MLTSIACILAFVLFNALHMARLLDVLVTPSAHALIPNFVFATAAVIVMRLGILFDLLFPSLSNPR